MLYEVLASITSLFANSFPVLSVISTLQPAPLEIFSLGAATGNSVELTLKVNRVPRLRAWQGPPPKLL